MKNFLYLIILCFVGITASPGYAENPDKSVAKPATMVTIFGSVSTFAPEDALDPETIRVMFYPFDKVTLKPGPLEAIQRVKPNGYMHQGNSGNFSITLSDEYLYKAKAVIYTADSRYGHGEHNFMSKFYPNTYDITEASFINLSDQPPVYGIGMLMLRANSPNDTTISLSGNVYDESNVPVISHVTAYRVDTDNNGIDTLTAYTSNDSLHSSISFPFIPQGEYILRVQPMDTLHEVGYYSETEGIVSAWQDATRIPVSTLDQIEKNIVLKPRSKAASGESTISGMISGRKPETGNFISMKGVRVYLKDESSVIKYSTYTNNNGNFSISNIAEGKYQIFADKPGYSMRVYNFEAKPEGNELVLDGIMNAGSITSVDNAEKTDKVEGQIYPNPTRSDQVMLQFSAHGKPSSLLITNTLGQLVFTTNIETTDGINTFPLNVSKFPSGVYSVIISTGAETIRLPQLQVVR